MDLRASLDDMEKGTFLTLPGLEIGFLGRPGLAKRYTDNTTAHRNILIPVTVTN
jgi:hypothetical protein